MLRLSGISKTFNKDTPDEKKALDNISLSLNEGDFVTIIGGNGSGKSTLMNIISGSILPDTGKISIDGDDVTMLPEFRRAKYLGRVFQDPQMGTAGDMRIDENLAIAYRRGKTHSLLMGITAKEKREFHALLSQIGLGLENRLSSEMKTLSGGQRQTITLLMATLNKPKILLLDEHTAALDPKTAKTVMEITQKIVTENNLTALMITHNMKDAIKYGNRLIMLNDGKIELDIKKEEKEKLSVTSLLEYFNKECGEEFANDTVLLA